jgi:LacI family gluconate utilization system Gnt-I transcriptional repressor
VSWRPAGVILSSRGHTPGSIQILKSSAVPVVEIWELNTSPIDMSIGFSHFDCGVEMAHFLRSKGHRKIGYLGALSKSDEYGKSRMTGFEQALKISGQGITERELLLDTPSFYAGYYGLETLLARRPDLDAVYFHNDEMAIGGIAYCQAKGISVPGDLGIAGWGGMEASAILPLRLTTTSVPTQALGKQAAQALVARLRGEPCQDVVAIPTRLIAGETV